MVEHWRLASNFLGLKPRLSTRSLRQWETILSRLGRDFQPRRLGIGFLYCPCQAPLVLVHNFAGRGRENVTMPSGRPVARHVGADGVVESVGPDKDSALQLDVRDAHT